MRTNRRGGVTVMAQSHSGASARIVAYFADSKLTPLVIVASLALGIAAVIAIPREEEPQIVVPMVDVMVRLPGASPREMERRVAEPMEQFLWEMPGVEYIYSTCSPEQVLTIVRFKVGERVEDSLVKLQSKLQSHFDRIPPGVEGPLIKPRSIDDVPVLALTCWADGWDPHRRKRRDSGYHDQGPGSPWRHVTPPDRSNWHSPAGRKSRWRPFGKRRRTRIEERRQ